MIIILRHNGAVGEKFRKSYAIGIFQLIWLCFVSFLFGSTYGGTLFHSLAFICTFVLVVALTRAASIEVCAWMVTKLDVVIIECATPEHKTQVEKAINEMPGTFVEVFPPIHKKWLGVHDRAGVSANGELRESKTSAPLEFFQIMTSVAAVSGFVVCVIVQAFPVWAVDNLAGMFSNGVLYLDTVVGVLLFMGLFQASFVFREWHHSLGLIEKRQAEGGGSEVV